MQKRFQQITVRQFFRSIDGQLILAEMDLDFGVDSTRKAVKSSKLIHTPKKRRGKASAIMVFATHPKKKKVGSRKGPKRA